MHLSVALVHFEFPAKSDEILVSQPLIPEAAMRT